eukprot:g3714.t1
MALASAIGHTIASLHCAGYVHGDLTTSNMMVREMDEKDINHSSELRYLERNSEPKRQKLISSVPFSFPIVLLDFGLGQSTANHEAKAVDLYVLERALLSTHPNSANLNKEILDIYFECSRDILTKEYRTKFQSGKYKKMFRNDLTPEKKANDEVDKIERRLEVVRSRGRKRVAFG